MSPTRSRAGVTLIEMIVALLLLLITLGIGSLTAQRGMTSVVRAAVVESRAGALSDALRTLSRHLANVNPLENDVRAAGDSVLDVVHTIGLSSVCRGRADTVLMTQAPDALPWSTVLPRNVTPDDELRIWNSTTGTWVRRGIRVVSAAGGACGDSSAAWPGNASQRVVMDDSIAGLRPGMLVRVLQRERWSLVRGGDGMWSLSLATWGVARGGFDTPQPLVSALASPVAAGGPGFEVHAIDRDGRRLGAGALTRVRSLLVLLRSVTHPRYGAYADSVRINVGAP